ncbi:hypothetical protein [Actinacidiphila glaucinigra]|uniref:hypothetical protein n=1 Tax=Actinacidiphila glaucinigra TaxID=235986 RepID=UPI0033E936FF
MTTGIIIGAVVVAVLIALAAVVTTRRGGGGTGQLRRRFGPEYERTVARHEGDTDAAHRELQERVDRHGGLAPEPLSARRTEEYRVEWAALQERFVDSPAKAVRDASALLDRLAHERGFPEHTSGEQIDALSVHRPRHLQAYRDLRGATEPRKDGDRTTADTEELRARLLGARALFDDLIAVDKEPRTTSREDGAGDADSGRNGSHRFHLPSWSSR